MKVSHWSKLDNQEVRYLLLQFAPYVSRGLSFQSKYLGFEAIATTSTMTMQGLPTLTDVSQEAKKIMEETLKSTLKDSIRKTNIQTLDILSLTIEKITPIVSKGNLNDRRRLYDDSLSEVVFTTTGEYIPPPYVNLKEVVNEVVDEQGSAILAQLKSSNDPFFSNLTEIVGVSKITFVPTISPTNNTNLEEPSTNMKKGTTNVASIFGIIVGLVGAMIAIFAVYTYIKREQGIDTDFSPTYSESQKSARDIDTTDAEDTISTLYDTHLESTRHPHAKISFQDNYEYNESHDHPHENNHRSLKSSSVYSYSYSNSNMTLKTLRSHSPY